MRKATIFFKDEDAGVLIQDDEGNFTFRYNDTWKADGSKPAISPTLPKTHETCRSGSLFPFFYNMLPEGSNKQVICNLYRIDPTEYFGLLMITAKHDSIGAVRVVNTEQQ